MEEPPAPVGTLSADIGRDILPAQTTLDHRGHLLDGELFIGALRERIHGSPPSQPTQHDADHAPGKPGDSKDLDV